MKKLIKFFIVFLLFCFGIIYFYYFNAPHEGYCSCCPRIQTYYSNGFTHRKYKQVKLGMKLDEVEAIIGKPIRYLGKPFNTNNYRRGYILGIYSNRKNWGFWKAFEYNYESIDIDYNSDSIVIGLYKEWWTD